MKIVESKINFNNLLREVHKTEEDYGLRPRLAMCQSTIDAIKQDSEAINNELVNKSSKTSVYLFGCRVCVDNYLGFGEVEVLVKSRYS